MKIGIALSPYSEKTPSGLGAFILQLTQALIEERPDWQFLVCVKGNPNVDFFSKYTNVSIRYLPDTFIWKDIAVIRNPDVDAWLYLNPSLPLFGVSKKSIIIVPDLSTYYDNPNISLVARCRQTGRHYLERLSFRRAVHVIAISEATKKDVHRFFPFVPSKSVSVAMCGFTRVCEVYEADQLIQLPETYYLMVGVLKPRKNQRTAIEAFLVAKGKGLKGKLIIVGKGVSEYAESLKALAHASEYRGDIIFQGYVTNEELVALYKHARAFVFPSHIEGFGMVIVEAMSCGVPVISSSNSAQGEVSNGYALTVDSKDVAGFTDAMLKLQDDIVREDLIIKGYERASHFSWKKSATEYAGIIEKISQ